MREKEGVLVGGRASHQQKGCACAVLAHRIACELFSVRLILWAVMVGCGLWMSVGGRRSGDAAVTDVTVL